MNWNASVTILIDCFCWKIRGNWQSLFQVFYDKKFFEKILIIDRNLYFLDPKRYKILRKIPLPNIKQIVISEKSAILMGIKIRNE